MKRLIPLLIVVGTAGLSMGMAVLADGSGQQIFGLPLLAALALLAFVIQWVAFVPAYASQTEHYYDLTGSLTYLSLVILVLWAGEAHTRAIVLGLMIGVWCIRLGSFLFRRVKQAGKDGRFDEIKKDWARFLVAWTLQGLWVFMTLLAALIAMSDATPASLDGWAVAGLLIWICGFGIEVIADAQKSAFRADPANAGRYIDTGLWAWSRHPNYFGEMLLWTGVCVFAVPAFEGWQWLGLLSPLFVIWLIGRVSGIPMLEERADAKWGGQAEYEQYKASTPVLMLRPPR